MKKSSTDELKLKIMDLKLETYKKEHALIFECEQAKIKQMRSINQLCYTCIVRRHCDYHCNIEDRLVKFSACKGVLA